MSLLFRVIVVFFSLFLALAAAGLAIALGLVLPDWRGVDSDPIERVTFFTVAFFATGFAAMAALLPAMVVIAIAEGYNFRSFFYYAVVGALLGLAAYFTSNIGVSLEETTDIAPVTFGLQLVTAAGIIGGAVYWMFAGRNAGKWKTRM
jgi:hypothetical protein